MRSCVKFEQENKLLLGRGRYSGSVERDSKTKRKLNNKADIEVTNATILTTECLHGLITTGFNDPRVAYWEPAKFIARLRDTKKGNKLAILQTNFNAGHAGPSGRYDSLEEYVLDFAFLIDRFA